MAKLTNKQARFVDEYLVDLNATQAAIRAGYSEKTAMEQGYQLLQKTSVQERIQILMNERSKRTEITADQVLEGIADIAFAEISEDISAANKLRGMELLGKHLAMFTERHVVEDNRPLKDESTADLEVKMHEMVHEVLGITEPTKH